MAVLRYRCATQAPHISSNWCYCVNHTRNENALICQLKPTRTERVVTQRAQNSTLIQVLNQGVVFTERCVDSFVCMLNMDTQCFNFTPRICRPIPSDNQNLARPWLGHGQGASVNRVYVHPQNVPTSMMISNEYLFKMWRIVIEFVWYSKLYSSLITVSGWPNG